ncbi:uncharacterized protein IL334_001145 [Kwoniella shivajii]|uniref:RING-type domain-containing protein n=1 Tax=Kwoniella shivajii TaxID=564305 RepID=A0ABZ1CRD1_9TREE|nr:hypothetical protein IL334_001145 [Kwoniella shivajii]
MTRNKNKRSSPSPNSSPLPNLKQKLKMTQNPSVSESSRGIRYASKKKRELEDEEGEYQCNRKEEEVDNDCPARRTRSHRASNETQERGFSSSTSIGGPGTMTLKKKAFIVEVAIPPRLITRSSQQSTSTLTIATATDTSKPSGTPTSYAKVLAPTPRSLASTTPSSQVSSSNIPHKASPSTSSKSKSTIFSVAPAHAKPSLTSSPQIPVVHLEIEAECIICSEELSAILSKAEIAGKGGLGGGLSLWSCELTGCGALFCITCALASIRRHSNSNSNPASHSRQETKPTCSACTREWDVKMIEEQAKAYDPSLFSPPIPLAQQVPIHATSTRRIGPPY